MNKIALATIAGALAILATPASAGEYGHGHGHSYGHSHVRYAHVQHHSHHYHKPTYSHGYVHQPVYYKPHYVKPVHVEPTTSYEKRPAYVYQKVAGYCVDVVKTYGYQQHRKTVECKAGEYKKAEAPEQPAPAPEQAPEQAPAPVEPPK